MATCNELPDQNQYERNPKEARQAEGGATVNLAQVVDVAEILRRAEAQRTVTHRFAVASDYATAARYGHSEPPNQRG